MKRLERLGSLAFGTILISLTFHLIAMSYNRWKFNECLVCDQTDPLGSWFNSIDTRCYASSMGSIFLTNDDPLLNKSQNSFITEICVPNKYLFTRKGKNSTICLSFASKHRDIVCSLGLYDRENCYCDFHRRTKSILGFSILVSLLLGSLIFLSHAISFIRLDSMLKRLLPINFILLLLTIISLILILILSSTHLDQDLKELRFSWSLIKETIKNETEFDYWDNELDRIRDSNYRIRVGWCFGLEILCLQFTTITLILNILMFLSKRRPDRFQ